MNQKSLESNTQQDANATSPGPDISTTPPPPPPLWMRPVTPPPPNTPAPSTTLDFFQPSVSQQAYSSQLNTPQSWATTSAPQIHPWYFYNTKLPWHNLPVPTLMPGYNANNPDVQSAMEGYQQQQQQEQGYQGTSPTNFLMTLDPSNTGPTAFTDKQKQNMLNTEYATRGLKQLPDQKPLSQQLPPRHPSPQQPPPQQPSPQQPSPQQPSPQQLHSRQPSPPKSNSGQHHPQPSVTQLTIRHRPAQESRPQRDPAHSPNLTSNDVDKLKRKAKKHKDPKIMLPGPEPTTEYLLAAAEEPFVIDPPARMLVILDLNGTLLYRPNPRKQPTLMVARPFLKSFLGFLFENFSVMIWSSAKPENVRVIVENALTYELRDKLVATWARDSFDLAPENYSRNVQVYKDLNLVWAKEEIQLQAQGYHLGRRFGQENTILIDDSAIKAIGQPYNLIEIPEFEATREQMKSDILREVAGYLQTARMQHNVSSFMKRVPFKADGRWQLDWEEGLTEQGEVLQN